MKLPIIQGVIRRRILANFRVDPQVMQQQLPSRFRPKLQGDFAVAGICLIRLDHIRPRFVPESVGLNSENAAHRVAVLWDEDGTTREGVFISRRDTNSQLNHLLGGRIFPGEHHQASLSFLQCCGIRVRDKAVAGIRRCHRNRETGGKHSEGVALDLYLSIVSCSIQLL